jgi:hypothetical protein
MAGARVHHIWRENSNEAFEEIRRLMSKRQGTLYIGMDLEYLADSKTNTKKKRPFTPEQWYSYLQDYVNSGAVV